jgi:hypothetical protein
MNWVFKQTHHILEEDNVVIADGYREIVGGDTILLAVLDERTVLRLLWNLDVRGEAAEDLIRLAFHHADENKIALGARGALHVNSVNIAG